MGLADFVQVKEVPLAESAAGIVQVFAGMLDQTPKSLIPHRPSCVSTHDSLLHAMYRAAALQGSPLGCAYNRTGHVGNSLISKLSLRRADGMNILLVAFAVLGGSF
jgi:hypothetical protein